jgi:hypothetical protein
MSDTIQAIPADDIALNLAFKESDGSPYDLTGAEVSFRVKRKIGDSDSDSVITKIVTSHTNAAAGLTTIDLSATDTNLALGFYTYDIRILTADSNRNSTDQATFEVAETLNAGDAMTSQNIEVNMQDRTIAIELTGVEGPAGTAGAGVPTGGLGNEFLKKLSSTNFDTSWVSATQVRLDLSLDQVPNVDATKGRGVTKTVGLTGISADYVCDGLADHVQIQQALDDVSALGGGTVHIRRGTYDIAVALTFHANVVVRGEGMFLTKLYANASIPNGKGIFSDRSYTPEDPLLNTEVSDMELDGSLLPRPAVGAGYQIGRKGFDAKYVRYGYWHDVYIHNFPATGFGIDNLSKCLVDHLIISDCGTAGGNAAVTLTSDNTNISAGETVLISNNYASATITSDLTNVANNNTVTIDTTVYTFKTVLTGAAYEVLIGATYAISLDNLADAVNAATAGLGVTYGLGTVAHPTVTATTNTDTTQKFVARLTGTGGNSIATTETSAHLSFGGSTMSGGSVRTYTFVSSLVSAFDVLIGADADASLTNLVAAINGATGEGTLYGTGTVAHGKVTAGNVSAHATIITATSTGPDGNDILVSETSAHLSFSAGQLSNGISGGSQGSNGVGIGVGGMPDESFVVSNCITINTAHTGYLLENLESNTGPEKMYIFTGNISLNDRIGFSSSGQSNFVWTGGGFYNTTTNAIQLIDFFHKIPHDFSISDTRIDTPGGKGMLIDGYSGIIGNVHLSGGAQEGIYMRGHGIVMNNVVAHDFGLDGIKVVGQTSNQDMAPASDYVWSNVLAYNNGRLTSSGDGIHFDASFGPISNIQLSHVRAYDDNAVKKQRYGVSVTGSGAIDEVSLTDMQLAGNATDGLFVVSTATNVTRRNVRGNISNYDMTPNAQSFTGSIPFNKSSGDITATRLMLGVNTTFQGVSLDAIAESVLTGSGAKSNIYSYLTVNPASSSSTEFRALRGTTEFKVDNVNTISTIGGVYGSTVISGNANVTNAYGGRFHGAIVPSTSSFNGATISNVWGVDITGFKISGTPPNAGTITTVKGIIINDNDAPSPLSITNSFGIDIAALTRGGTLNVGLRIAAPSGATNNYAIQLNDTGGTLAGGITFGTGTSNLYRSAASTLKTDGSFVVGGTLTAGTYVGQSSIVTLGTITAGVWNGTTIAIANGGTGQVTANAALNALLPSQTGNSGKFLTTNGTDSSWGTVAAVSAQSLLDTNGNNALTVTTTASAVSFLNITNAASGGTITLAATASSGTPNFIIKGSGTFALRPTTNGTNAIRLQDSAGTGNVLVADTTNIRIGIGKTTPTVTLDVGGIIGLLAGGSTTIAKAGGTIFNHFADAGNSTTAETDLYSDSIPASALGTNGDKLEAIYGCIFVNSTSTKQLKLYFGGTAIFDTGALTISASSEISMEVLIIRVNSTVVRYVVRAVTTGASTGAYSAVGELTGLTLTNANVLKITGTAAGVGAATNDIVAKASTVEWKSAA